MVKLLPALAPGGVIDPDVMDEAAAALRAGKLVALPTETVYCLGANALDEHAVRRIFEAKERPTFNPLIVHVAELEDAHACSSNWPALADRLAERFWPGPLTLIVSKAPVIPAVVTGGLDAVAVRIPAHPVARELLRRAGVPVAAPSANPFGWISPTTAEHVVSGLGDRIDLVLDGGPCDVGIESTVLDLTTNPPRLLRPGGVSAEEIQQLVGEVALPHTIQDEGARSSPGLLSRHYSPRGKTVLLSPAEWAEWLSTLPTNAVVGAVVRTAPRPDDPRVAVWKRLGDAPQAYARDLYAALHSADAAGCSHVLLERLPESPEWRALSDRLGRAAG